MLVVVVLLFGICWLPLHVFILALDFHPQIAMAVNPLLYMTIIYPSSFLSSSPL